MFIADTLVSHSAAGHPPPSERPPGVALRLLGCEPSLLSRSLVSPLPGVLSLPLALQTAGDAGDGLLLFGLDMASLQRWTLIYLAVSSLAFVLVWLIGFLRR